MTPLHCLSHTTWRPIRRHLTFIIGLDIQLRYNPTSIECQSNIIDIQSDTNWDVNWDPSDVTRLSPNQPHCSLAVQKFGKTNKTIIQQSTKCTDKVHTWVELPRAKTWRISANLQYSWPWKIWKLCPVRWERERERARTRAARSFKNLLTATCDKGTSGPASELGKENAH